MDYFSPGPRELARKLHRRAVEHSLAAINRKLAKAETDLGLLGWQQADYDPETQRQVQEIQGVEKEQSRLVNDSAEVAKELRDLQSERQTAQRQYEDQLRQLEGERRRLREPHEVIEKQLAEKRKTEPVFVQRIPELDRELRETQKLYAEFIQVSPQTPQVRQELARLRERIVAIPNEKSDLRTQHLRTASDIRNLEEQVEKSLPDILAVEEKIRVLQEEWATAEHGLNDRLAVKQDQKKQLEAKMENLEASKSNPYLRIGQVLADNNIAPLNQPEALDRVKRLRFEAGECRQIILESEARSHAEKPAAVKLSMILWGVILLVLLLILVLKG